MFNKQEIKNTIYSPPTFKAFQSNGKQIFHLLSNPNI